MRDSLKVGKWLLSGALLVTCFAVPAVALPPADREPDITRQEVQSFDRFLDSHPQIARDLRQNPSLVNDPAYRTAHPELGEFLQNHPRVREELRENPKRFMQRERQHERRERQYHRRH